VILLDFPYLLIPEMISQTFDRYTEKLGHPVPVRKVVIESGQATFVGDTHGALDVSSYALAVSRSSSVICFVGDLVDRGKNQLFNFLFVVESAIICNKIIIVRGNHESILTNDYYGFTDELKEMGLLDEVYPHIVRLYGRLPYALLLNGSILVVHGGIPNDQMSIESWESLPMDDPEPSNPTAFQILWNDPREYVDGFLPGTRGEGTYLFGPDAFDDFSAKNGITLMVRAHEVKKTGYEYMFQGKLVSIFSSRYHKGKAALLRVTLDADHKQSIIMVPDGEDTIKWPADPA
jgi:protein phosphatase